MITGKVQLGELEALVVSGIKENLVSISDLTSKGSTMELSDSGGVISNPVNDLFEEDGRYVEIEIRRRGYLRSWKQRLFWS